MASSMSNMMFLSLSTRVVSLFGEGVSVMHELTVGGSTMLAISSFWVVSNLMYLSATAKVLFFLSLTISCS